ncbi:hypothetical protein TIFTF001_021214 [Ficus carica]|uniref:Uncharacterized protein n=1 Tax=Ficus carica TaxID=3494 RepID=A0AA88AYP4_FICCA|nr:hypothetical protein TIFTF001_021214 [Ficus carica]
MDSTVNMEEISVKSCGENKRSTSEQQRKRGRPKKDNSTSTSTSTKDELNNNDVKKSKHQLPDHDESKEALADTSTSRDERSEKNVVDHQDHADVVPNRFDHVSKRRRRRKGMPRRAAV